MDVVNKLIKAGADHVIQDKDGYSPLHSASKKGNEEIVQMLLDANADKETKTTKGESPLHLASQVGHVDIVKMLVDVGAAVNSRQSWKPLPCSWHLKKATLRQCSSAGQDADTEISCNNGNTPSLLQHSVITQGC